MHFIRQISTFIFGTNFSPNFFRYREKKHNETLRITDQQQGRVNFVERLSPRRPNKVTLQLILVAIFGNFRSVKYLKISVVAGIKISSLDSEGGGVLISPNYIQRGDCSPLRTDGVGWVVENLFFSE